MILADWRDRTRPDFSVPMSENHDALMFSSRGLSQLSDTRRSSYQRRLTACQAELVEIEDNIETAQTYAQKFKFKKEAERILKEIDELES